LDRADNARPPGHKHSGPIGQSRLVPKRLRGGRGGWSAGPASVRVRVGEDIHPTVHHVGRRSKRTAKTRSPKVAELAAIEAVEAAAEADSTTATTEATPASNSAVTSLAANGAAAAAAAAYEIAAEGGVAVRFASGPCAVFDRGFAQLTVHDVAVSDAAAAPYRSTLNE
jgi:hypothetical protein